MLISWFLNQFFLSTGGYLRADTEMKRVALKKANKDLVPFATPVWQKGTQIQLEKHKMLLYN